MKYRFYRIVYQSDFESIRTRIWILTPHFEGNQILLIQWHWSQSDKLIFRSEQSLSSRKKKFKHTWIEKTEDRPKQNCKMETKLSEATGKYWNQFAFCIFVDSWTKTAKLRQLRSMSNTRVCPLANSVCELFAFNFMRLFSTFTDRRDLFALQSLIQISQGDLYIFFKTEIKSFASRLLFVLFFFLNSNSHNHDHSLQRWIS